MSEITQNEEDMWNNTSCTCTKIFYVGMDAHFAECAKFKCMNSWQEEECLNTTK